MKVVVCLSGLDISDFVRRVHRRLPPESQLVLLYVVDTRPATELNFIRRQHLFGAKTGVGRQLEMQEAEREIANAVLEEARTAFEQSGWRVVELVALEGRPQEQIVQFTFGQAPDLLVLGVRYKGDMNNPKAGRGPQSIGPVARFIIDHAPCDLLVIK